MYLLYPLGCITHDPNALWLSYEWGDSFENREWRRCVEHFLDEVAKLGYSATPLPSPAFTPGEDFVEITYLVGGVKTTFTSDQLLSLITIHPEDPVVLHDVWKSIGDHVGWRHQS